jgi:glycerophosphoryl diester phosphodiesterase
VRSRRGFVLAIVAGALAFSALPGSSATSIKLIAHRGGAGLWPENTMLAFRNAAALFGGSGVPGWLELDTQFTKDKILIVLHDATLDRTTDCAGPVVQKRASVVTGCDADPDPGHFEGVPLLSQVLAEAKTNGWRLMIEIKDIPNEPGFDPDCIELADALHDAVGAAGFSKKNLIVQSFWPPCLDRLELTAPAMKTLLLTISTLVSDVTGVDTPVPVGFTLTANMLYAASHRYEYSAPDQDSIDLTKPVVNAAHLLGLQVVTWTVDDAATMRKLRNMGIDGIISNRPDLLIATLAA